MQPLSVARTWACRRNALAYRTALQLPRRVVCRAALFGHFLVSLPVQLRAQQRVAPADPLSVSALSTNGPPRVVPTARDRDSDTLLLSLDSARARAIRDNPDLAAARLDDVDARAL
ncbi:MAG: hypothetical protein HY084_07830 [Gemmatimonadetes bacterium]|nr:hypothetical protein [Gemmatimonadota bacterium]